MTNVDTRDLEEERDCLLQSLEDLDRDHASGLLGDEEYVSLRDQQVVRAAAVLRALEPADALPKPGSSPMPVSIATAAKSQQKWLWISGIAVLILISAVLVVRVADDRVAGETSTGSTADSSVALLAQAEDQTAKGDVADAVKTYDKVLRIDANNAQALAYRGWLIRLAGLPDKGLESIDRAIAARPAYPDAHFFRGFILLRDKNDPSGAITEFDAFLANNPPRQMVSLVEQARQDAVAQLAAPKPTP